jgi:glycosyltransferase involved in cell wall biosynthesis
MVDGFGLTFPPGDVDALAACMRLVISDDSLANELGSRAQEHASERYTQERMINEHLDILCAEVQFSRLRNRG